MVMKPNEKSNSYFKMNCNCGSKKCRKIITEDDWEIPELQKRYNGYFQYYLQEEINKNRNINLSKKDKSYQLLPAPWDKK